MGVLRQKAGWWATLSLGYKAIGIIFGDIGTSPLYTYANVFQTPPTHAELLGATSMIFWTITLVVLLKCAAPLLLSPSAGFLVCAIHSRSLADIASCACRCSARGPMSSHSRQQSFLVHGHMLKSRLTSL